MVVAIATSLTLLASSSCGYSNVSSVNIMKQDSIQQVINVKVEDVETDSNKNSLEDLLENKAVKDEQSLNKDNVENIEAVIDDSKIDKALLKKISYQISADGQAIAKFKEEEKTIAESPENYSILKGVTCFRGNTYRDSPSYGTTEVKEKKLEVIWSLPIGSIDSWSGVGWNGQPAIVEWPDDLKGKMNIIPEKVEKSSLKEVIYAALDGKVYFLDLDDGKATRKAISIPGPVKGSLTVDPRGYPLLYVGQGINTAKGKTVEMGYRIFSLIDQKKLFFINGKDSFAYRGWPAFDSTALIDSKSDSLIIGGENGLFYKVKLNSSYNDKLNKVSVNPQVLKYRYKIYGNNHQGIENSVAIYRNLAYFADNGGWMQCIDLNSLKPVWILNVSDDTDSTIVLEEEGENKVALYTACEVDKQGNKGKSYIRKIDALYGKVLWQKPYDCQSILGKKPNNGGALATPIIGKCNIDNMVIFNLARCGGFNSGRLVALDKGSGNELWRLDMKNYSWSSPVPVYNSKGECFVLVCDSAGKMSLIEGKSGKILHSISLGSNVEGSPAVFGDMVVVGTRGQKIFGVKIK
jgi:outer membrane protein assembly factor BamB